MGMEPKVTISSKKNARKVLVNPDKSVNSPRSQQPLKTALKRNKATTPAIEWRSAPRRPHKKQNRWYQRNQEMISITLSIVGAVIVGVIMGASLLSIFFNNEPTYSKNSIDSHLKQVNQEQKQSVEKKLRVYLLQAGNFQHKSGAEDKILSYRKQGLAAVLSATPPYRVYLGVSLDQAGAKKLASSYENKGMKVFIKEMTIPLKKKNMGSKELEVFNQQSQKIFTELSKRSIAQLSTEQPGDKQFTLPSKIDESYQALLSSAEQIKPQLPAKEQDHLLTMIQSLDQAVQSAKEATSQPSTALLWQIQEGLVRYITTYEIFI